MTSPPGQRQVAAVIVTWRTPATTADLVCHLRRVADHVSVVLVDCGSTGQPSLPDTDDVVVLHTRNLGYAGGNNLGIRHALANGADYVVVINSDCYPVEGCIESMLSTLERHPAAGACGAVLLGWDARSGPELSGGRSFDWRTGMSAAIAPPDDTTEVDFAHGALLLFRAECLRQVGAFDSNLFLCFEEIDWSERARAAGWSTIVAPGARAVHLVSRTTSMAMKAMTYFLARNRLIVLRRHSERHGARFRPAAQAAAGVRVAAGHAARGRLGLVGPSLRGLVAGLLGPLASSDDPAVAVRQQRWETRDSSDAGRACRSEWGSARPSATRRRLA